MKLLIWANSLRPHRRPLSPWPVMRHERVRANSIFSNGRRSLLLVLAAGVVLYACNDRDLRGTASPSEDGKTYLVIEDDGAVCSGLEIDGVPWRYELDRPGQISPGMHEIGCSGERLMSFEIPQGTTFNFDYWGP